MPQSISRLGILNADNSTAQRQFELLGVVTVCVTDFPVQFRVLLDIFY